MFIFHEGLPGSGKSFEAIVNQILPALEKGRKVYAYINGLNHEKIAELTKRPIDEINENLIQLQPEHMEKVYEHVEKDALIVLDEMQNFWPTKGSQISKELRTWISEHRHHGQDIVGMGQSIKDINAIWRRRCEQKIQFLKRSAIGKPDSYKWTMFQGVPKDDGSDVTFIKMNSGTKDYDKKYFGSYKSHQDGTSNYETKSDDRINIFNNNTFKVFIPLIFVGAIYAVYWLYTSFFGNKPPVATGELEQQTYQSSNITNKNQVVTNKLPPPPPPIPRDDIASFVIENNESYRPALVFKEEMYGHIYDLLVVWTDDNNKMIDQLYLSDFKELGFKIINKSYGFIAEKGKAKLLFRYRPHFDAYASIPKDTREQLNDENTN